MIKNKKGMGKDMSLKEKFYMGKHQKMERFSFSFIALMLTFFVVLSVGFKQNLNFNSGQLKDIAVYNTTFKTSRTGINGKVIDVYGNENKTKAFVLLKFEDIGSVSVDSKNYQMFLTPAQVAGNRRVLKNEPTGGLFVFGNTGYMGIYLINNAGFDEQILSTTIRANAELVRTQNQAEDEVDDASFTKYDQFIVHFNPGSEKVTIAESLNGEGVPNPRDLYRDTVSSTELEMARDLLDSNLEDMRISLNRVTEYTKRVEDLNVDVPEIPVEIRGDEITTSEEGVISYKLPSVLQGGLDYDWRNGTFKDSFIADAKKSYGLGSNVTNEQFFITQEKDRLELPTSLTVDFSQWRLKNGTLIEGLNTGLSYNEEYMAINKAMTEMVQSWDDYYKLKRTYQTQNMLVPLQLESILNRLENTSSINLDEGVLWIY